MASHWDPEGKYSDLTIKEYKYWLVQIQLWKRALGGLMIFLKRPSEKFSDLKTEEFEELKLIMKEMEMAIGQAFQPDRFNYLQLGNVTTQLHFHCYPRYATSRTFAGVEWVDTTYGSLPTSDKTESTREVAHMVRDEIKKFIP